MLAKDVQLKIILAEGRIQNTNHKEWKGAEAEKKTKRIFAVRNVANTIQKAGNHVSAMPQGKKGKGKCPLVGARFADAKAVTPKNTPMTLIPVDQGVGQGIHQVSVKTMTSMSTNSITLIDQC